VVEADPEALATRTKSKQVQDVPADHGNPPHDLNIGQCAVIRNSIKSPETSRN
jgi:hypothetical protein